MPITRRFLTVTIACLALSAMTIGCGTSTTENASTIASQGSPVVVDEPATVAQADKNVQVHAEHLEGQITDAEGRATKAAGETEGEVKRTVYEAKGQIEGVAGELRNDSNQATGEVRQAVDQIKGGARKAVGDAEAEAKRRAKAIKDGVEKSDKDLEKDVLDGFLPPR